MRARQDASVCAARQVIAASPLPGSPTRAATDASDNPTSPGVALSGLEQRAVLLKRR